KYPIAKQIGCPEASPAVPCPSRCGFRPPDQSDYKLLRFNSLASGTVAARKGHQLASPPSWKLRQLSVFCRDLGELVGGWGNIAGFLQGGQSAATSTALRIATVWKKEQSRILIASSAALAVLFFGAIFYLRHAGVSGTPQAYLYLEVGGTLISFCYAA